MTYQRYGDMDREKLRALTRAGLRDQQARLDAERANEPSEAAWWMRRITWLLVLKAAVLAKLLHWIMQ